MTRTDEQPAPGNDRAESADGSSVETSLRSAGWVSLWSLGQLIVQFGLQVVLANYFGAGAEMDAFVSAIALPTVLSSIFVGSLNFALVPVFSQRLNAGDERGAWESAAGIGILLVAFTAALSAAVFWAAEPLTRTLYPGFDGPQADTTSRLVAILIWLLVSNGLIAFSTAILHCRSRFAVPAAAPVIGTSVTLALTLAYYDRGIVAIAAAVLAGSVVVALLQLAAMPISRLRLPRHVAPGVVQCLRLMTPLVLGAMFFRLDPLVDRYLASQLSTGSIAHLGYAMRLITALMLVTTSGLAVVAFPSFAKQHASGNPQAFRGEIAHAVRCLCVITMPIVIGLSCYSHFVIRDLFQRGEFLPADTHAVAALLVLYLGMIAGAAFGDVASKIFFALSNTRTPTVIGCAGFGMGLILKLLITPHWEVFGIAAATSAYYLGNALVMLAILRVRLGNGIYQGVTGSLLRSALASGAAVLVVAPIVWSPIPLGAFLGALVGAVAYVVALLALRDEFATRMLRYVGGLLGFSARE